MTQIKTIQAPDSSVGLRKKALSGVWVMIGAILVLALVLRLIGLDFGLPALYDPDEPVFVMNGLKLLRESTLNPGWFGHPGTTTIYAMAAIQLAVYAIGALSGRFPDPEAFAKALYADPGLVVLPGRLFILLCGLLCVLLIFMIGRRLFDNRVGLAAAALLAINPLHIKYSQIIRTDVQASVFMLLATLVAINIATNGRRRDYILAGLWTGLACATKWPALLIIAAPVGACFLRVKRNPSEARSQIANILLTAVVTPLSLLAISPYLLLDHQTLVANLMGEAQTHHLGATGHGLIGNVRWYFSYPILDNMGPASLPLIGAGAVAAAARNRIVLATILPATLIFLAAICAQALIWERWIVPMLPFFSLFIAVAMVMAYGWASARWGYGPARIAILALACGVAIPMALAARAEAIERRHDTRQLVSDWARRHIPPGSTVAIEHLAFDLLPQRWTILLPAGDAGCINAAAELGSKVPRTRIDQWRGARSNIDFGTLNPATRESCRADFMILSHYDRYLTEKQQYPDQVTMYEQFMADGRQQAMFRPVAGRIGGPTIRLLKMNPPKDLD